MLTYAASEGYWQQFYAWSSEKKKSIREKWKIFKQDPFDPRLGTHKINRLSAMHGKTVYGVRIEADLRVIFLISGSEVLTLGIGSHDIYK